MWTGPPTTPPVIPAGLAENNTRILDGPVSVMLNYEFETLEKVYAFRLFLKTLIKMISTMLWTMVFIY